MRLKEIINNAIRNSIPTCICLLSLLKITYPVGLYAQDNSKNEYSFKVIVPQETITQGNQIEIKYVLEAPSYSVTTFNGGLEGEKRIKLDYSKSALANGINRLTVTATYQVNSCGAIKVLPMSAEFRGETILSDSTTIIVLPNAEYGYEWYSAKEFLEKKGVQADGLKYKFDTETLIGLSDDKKKIFAIVARKKFESCLDNPVLAYSIESSLWKNTDTESSITLSQIINNYEQQLKELQSKDSIYSGTHIANDLAANTRNGRNLLEDRLFGQEQPYNDLFPTDESSQDGTQCVAGCGPVALAHILSYYHNPIQFDEHGFIHLNSGKKISINLNDYPIDWSETDSDLANLMLDCAASLGAEVSSSSSTTTMNNFKSALTAYWNYSPQCLYVNNVSDMELISMTYSELNNDRPVIVGGQSHIYVCDGYDQDYLHFNFGWNGKCNGYFRVLVADDKTSNKQPFNEILANIEPLKEFLSDTITVQEPGTLSTLIEKESWNKLTSLTVKGTINGDDIRFIRNMAGAIDVYDPSKGIGSLMYLDLSEVKIKGGDSYAVFYADGYTISGTEYIIGKGDFKYSYNLSNITDSQWKTILKYELDNRGDMLLERNSAGRVLISYHTQDNDVIGKRMFADCQNLRTVTLPKSALRIDEDAFYNCRSLQQVLNQPGRVSKKAFRECRILEDKK